MDVVLYCRVSDEDQREKCTIEMQVDYGQRYAAELGLRVMRIYQDDGVHNWVPMDQRPDGRRLVADAPTLKAQGCSLILFYRWDRVGRAPYVVFSATHQLEDLAGLRMKSMTEMADTSSPEKLLLLLLNVGAANIEHKAILERSLNATRMLARQGTWLGGGRPPFGYSVEGSGRRARLVLNEEEAEVVRLIYRLSADEGWSGWQIARHLNALGVPTANARRDYVHGRSGQPLRHLWTGTHISGYLRSTVYRGEHQWGKHGKGEIISREVPAVVDPATWERAQRQIDANRKKPPGNATREYLLRGLIRCGNCGLRYRGATSSTGEQYYYYTCNGRENLVDRCRGRRLHGPNLDVEVWGDIEAFARNPGAVLEQIAEQLHTGEGGGERARDEDARVRMALAGKSLERERVLTLFRRGLITDVEVDLQLAHVQAESAVLQERLEQLADTLGRTAAAQIALTQARDVLAEIAEELEKGEPKAAFRRRAVAALVHQVTTTTTWKGQKAHAKVEISYRFDRRVDGVAGTGAHSCNTVRLNRERTL